MSKDNMRNCTFHEDIGIVDTNDKPICANCNIVEFNYYHVEHETFYKVIGYFTYEFPSYRLKILEAEIPEYSKDLLSVEYQDKRNIKTIDTVQENKLGLIKD